MTAAIVPSHVAILVRSGRTAADHLSHYGFQIEPEEIWQSEGTKEIYIEGNKGNSLLLIEPIGAGPYQRAMEKRGPGIHHFAIDVLDLGTYISSISGTGWLLHPKSLETVEHSRMAYLARPGFPGLIEVQEKPALAERAFFVRKVSLDVDAAIAPLLGHVGLNSIVETGRPTVSLLLGDHLIALQDLLS